MKILFIGDITGNVGVQTTCKHIARLKKEYQADLVIVNGENAAEKNGITEEIYRKLRFAGADVVTLGNHSFDRAEICDIIDDEPYLVRPYNYPKGTPGNGYTIVDLGKEQLAVVSLMGNVFVSSLISPFEVIDELIEKIHEEGCRQILIDLHAEATSEKIAFGYYVDGRVSAVVGTHTHVQTADEKILPGGTAYITDCGMTGPYESVLGVVKELAIERFCTQRPVRFAQGQGIGQCNGVLIELEKGKATAIQRISFVEKEKK